MRDLRLVSNTKRDKRSTPFGEASSKPSIDTRRKSDVSPTLSWVVRDLKRLQAVDPITVAAIHIYIKQELGEISAHEATDARSLGIQTPAPSWGWKSRRS